MDPIQTTILRKDLPNAPILVVNNRESVILTTDGELINLDKDQTIWQAKNSKPILCNAMTIARYLKIHDFPALDLLELFAFVRPAEFTIPTPRGLADFFGLTRPETSEEMAETLMKITGYLLNELATAETRVYNLAYGMSQAGWSWGPTALKAIKKNKPKHAPTNNFDGLKVWNHLSEWEEDTPPPPPGHLNIDPAEIAERLMQLLENKTENRPQQIEYAIAIANAFAESKNETTPKTVIAEAGTGVGKTLGYLAPASVWADKNQGSVWISTFTRNLQRQLNNELNQLYPDPIEKMVQTVIRKGRENYLCLLNLEESIGQSSADHKSDQKNIDLITLGLVARWLHASKDGDMIGGDFPAWLSDLMGRHRTIDLTDTRGECIYSACNHYSKCFIEKSVRRARRARLVIANHALVMIQSVLTDDLYRPNRYIFDEGHHIFDAADNAFSTHLTGIETSDLRRWIMGSEGKKYSRARGLRARIEDLILENKDAMAALSNTLIASQILPKQGWQERISNGNPSGPAEKFLALIRKQAYARDKYANGPYNIETAAYPPIDNLANAAGEFSNGLSKIYPPVRKLIQILADKLGVETDDLDKSTRQRIEAILKSLDRRCISQIIIWQEMLKNLENNNAEDLVDFISVERHQGYEYDIGLHRHYIDPTKPFADKVLNASDGALITSATLRDEENWYFANARTGLEHMEEPPSQTAVPSPFDYVNQARVYIINNIEKNNLDQLAFAYRELMIASNGGVLGLFTSILRLRKVHQLLAKTPDLDKFMLLAQHVDVLDTGTLVDIFRAEDNACLLGTDAVRDGIDVPGRALRLIIYDRVPWPRPTILHKSRKIYFESKQANMKYDDVLTRLKLKQAFGRLTRQENDRGIFIMLDRAMPSRLMSAFPEGIKIQRLGLAETVKEVKKFLIPT